MSSNTPIPDDKKADHLILLVGGNPLPNAVASSLLSKAGGQITLIHSRDTFPVARQLKKWLLNQKELALADERVVLSEVQESEAHTVYRAVEATGRRIERGASIGLHYTGGTKAMSVHAYRALEHWVKTGQIRATEVRFSYLDARTQKLLFDPPHPESGASAQTEDVSLANVVTLDDLFALHGWRLNQAVSAPFLPQTSAALMQADQDLSVWAVWNQWKKQVLLKMCRREDKPEKWKTQGQLRNISLPWPESPLLAGITRALQTELAQSGPTLSLVAAAQTCGKREIEDFCQWLDGGYWLETVVLQALHNIADTCAVHDVYMNLNPQLEGKETNFELDVVAMRGYQLFACSCSIDTHKRELKRKLFEAYVRARQLGGDEAQVALICGSDDPQGLADEIRQTLSSEGQIRVFGKRDWPNLADELRNWITSRE